MIIYFKYGYTYSPYERGSSVSVKVDDDYIESMTEEDFNVKIMGMWEDADAEAYCSACKNRGCTGCKRKGKG